MTTTFPAFPSYPGITWPVKRMPSGKTIRHEAIQGKRTLLPQMVTPRWSWEIAYEFLRSLQYGAGSFPDLEGLSAFYLAQMMGGTCFAYTDDEDNAVTAQGFGQGDGTTTTFQLVRARGGYTEPVLLPAITGLTVAGVAKTAGTDFTLGDKGIVTFTSAPAGGAALQWTGTFAWLCRFAEDSLDLSRFMVGLSEAKSLKFDNEIDP
jgi:uncharacterized protein (TIGR02217 family)